KCRSRARATGACAPHVQVHNAILKTVESDVTTVIGNRGTHSGFKQFLDRAHGFFIFRIIVTLRLAVLGWVVCNDGRARHIMIHNGTEDCRLDMLPFSLILGHRYEVGAQKDALYSFNIEEAACQWRTGGFGFVTKVDGSVTKHGPTWDEL